MRTKPSTKLASPTLSAIDALDAHWAAFDAVRAKNELDTLAERPPGGMTAAEYMERYNLRTEAEAYRQIRKMESAGDVKRVFCCLPDKRGHLSRIAVFVPCATR